MVQIVVYTFCSPRDSTILTPNHFLFLSFKNYLEDQTIELLQTVYLIAITVYIGLWESHSIDPSVHLSPQQDTNNNYINYISIDSGPQRTIP